MRAKLGSLSAADRTLICTIVLGEVRYGVERMPRGRRRHELETKVAELLARVPCESVPEEAGNYYARIKRETERRGARLDKMIYGLLRRLSAWMQPWLPAIVIFSGRAV